MRRALALLLLAIPSLARADAFEPPPGKSAVEVVVGLENAADYPGYTFVLWPHACYGDSSSDHAIVRARDDVPGREQFMEESCQEPRLFAFPLDAFPLEGGALSQAARAQLTRGAPADARVLVTDVDAETLWWTPVTLSLLKIYDVYRVEIAGTSLKLEPTRVLFDFGDRRVLDRPFYKGRRPRLPREADIPPVPPPEPTAPAADAPPVPSDTSPATAPAPSPTPAPVPADPAQPPAPSDRRTPPAPASAPATEPARREQPARIPPALLYGGGCLLVALGAGLALRRR